MHPRPCRMGSDPWVEAVPAFAVLSAEKEDLRWLSLARERRGRMEQVEDVGHLLPLQPSAFSTYL